MKKIISVLIIIMLLVVGTITVNATEEKSVEPVKPDIDVLFTMPQTVEEGTKEITATIALGSFVKVTENQPMGYEVTLEINPEIVENIIVTGLNDWTAQYSNDKIIGETMLSKPNVSIAKITITLKDTVKGGEKVSLGLKNMNITDALELDKTISITKSTNVLEKKVEVPTNQVEENKIVENTVKNTVVEENKIVVKDETVKNAVLPKAGSYSVVIAIGVLLLLGVIGIVRYCSIETKIR